MCITHRKRKGKNSAFCCPLAIYMMQSRYYYYYQMMMIDWLKEEKKKKKRDNLTPRHLRVQIDDELQMRKTYPILCVVISNDDDKNWTKTVVNRFLSCELWAHSFSLVFALYWALVILIVREKKNDTSLSLSFTLSLCLSFLFIRIHTCQLMVNNTDVNFEKLQL